MCLPSSIIIQDKNTKFELLFRQFICTLNNSAILESTRCNRFGEVRETPSVIRKGVFGLVRHPIYLSEVLLYLGLFMLNMSLAAGAVWIGATVFLYYLSRYEEKLLLKRFGDGYRTYMREVGMWTPRLRRK